MATTSKTIIFIHGLWLHPISWTEWEKFFQKVGYKTLAVDWPGDAKTVKEARLHPEKVSGYGVQDVANFIAEQITNLKTKPIVIGHSFGGLIAQKLLDQGLASAAIGIDAAQIKGVLPLPFEQLKSGFPVLKNPFNYSKSVMLTQSEFRYGFGNAVTEKESNDLYQKWVIPSPAKPLFEAAFGNFNPTASTKINVTNSKRGPLLLIAGGQDHTVPAIITHSTYDLYKNSKAKTEIKEFEDRGHSLALDKGWKEVAEYSHSWLKKQKIN